MAVMEPQADLSAQASALMKEWGPVHAGSSAGDFGTITLDQSAGWVVTSHHNDILTYVGLGETSGTEDVVIGLLGRSKRNQDAQEL